MHTINKLQIEINKLQEIREKENNWEIEDIQAFKQREIIRDRIFSILDREEYLINK